MLNVEHGLKGERKWEWCEPLSFVMGRDWHLGIADVVLFGSVVAVCIPSGPVRLSAVSPVAAAFTVLIVVAASIPVWSPGWKRRTQRVLSGFMLITFSRIVDSQHNSHNCTSHVFPLVNEMKCIFGTILLSTVNVFNRRTVLRNLLNLIF